MYCLSPKHNQEIEHVPQSFYLYLNFLAKFYPVSYLQEYHQNVKQHGYQSQESGFPKETIDNYLAFSASYRSDSDVAYNQRHPQKVTKRYHTNAASAQSKKLTILRQFYRYLQKYYDLPSNPAALADSPKLEKNKEVVALDDSEVREVLSDVQSGAKLQGRSLIFAQKTQLRDIAILKLMLGTGIRVSELVGIDLHHINWAKHYIEIYRKERKNQRVFMPEDVESALTTYIESERKPADKNDKALFISPRTGTRLTVRSVERIIKKYAVPVGGERIHSHSM